jgi:hypothetical protein
MCSLLLTGCQVGSTGSNEGEREMYQLEDEELKEKAAQYIKEKYQKEFEVKGINRGRVTGTVYVDGIVKDGKDTETSIIWERNGQVGDTYVSVLWTNELKPKIEALANKHMEVRRIEDIVYSSGKIDKYTGNIPSVFEVLKNGGDPDFALQVTLRVYEHAGQFEKGLKEYLDEIKGLGINEIIITVFVVDDQLKSAQEDVKESSYTLYRYNIVINDIQKVDIVNLDLNQYKTVIKE